MKKKSFFTHWVTIKAISLLIRGNMHTDNKHFTVINRTKAIFKINFAVSDRFNFCAEKLYTGFISFKHKIIVIGFFIICNYLLLIFIQVYHSLIYIKLLPSSARESVTSSAYSRSAPTGTP